MPQPQNERNWKILWGLILAAIVMGLAFLFLAVNYR